MAKFLILLAPIAVALTACGGSAGDSTSSVTAAAPPAVSANADLAAKVPDDIKAKGSLKVATDGTIGEPFASFGADNKTLQGLNIDVARAIGSALGMEVELVNTPFGTFIPGLQAGRYDYSVSVMLDTKERQKVVDFVDYLKDGSGFLVRSDDERADLTPETACGTKVGVIKGSVELETMTKAAEDCKSAGQPEVALSVFDENAQGVLALTSQRIDAWAGSSAQNFWIKSQNKGKLKVSGPVFNEAIDGIAIPKDSPLVPLVHQALQHLMDTGTYGEIFGKYGMQEAQVEKATINEARY